MVPGDAPCMGAEGSSHMRIYGPVPSPEKDGEVSGVGSEELIRVRGGKIVEGSHTRAEYAYMTVASMTNYIVHSLCSTFGIYRSQPCAGSTQNSKSGSCIYHTCWRKVQVDSILHKDRPQSYA